MLARLEIELRVKGEPFEQGFDQAEHPLRRGRERDGFARPPLRERDPAGTAEQPAEARGAGSVEMGELVLQHRA